MASTEGDEQIFAGRSGRLLLVLSIGWLVVQMGRQLLPPLLPAIIQTLDITPFLAGLTLTVLWGVYALCQYPSGRLSDRLSRKTVTLTGLGLTAVGFGAIGLSRTYPAFLCAVVVGGIGTGLFPTAARANISDLFVARRGQALGIHTAMGSVGNALAAGVAAIVLAVAVWPVAFVPVVGISVLILLANAWWSDEPFAVSLVPLNLTGTIRTLLWTPDIRLLIAGYSLYAFTWQGAAGFLPLYLESTKGFTPTTASLVFATLFVVGGISKPIAGAVGDRFGRRRVAAGALGIGIVGIGILVAASTRVTIIVGVVVFAAGLMAYPPVMQAFLMDRFPVGRVGGDLGAMRTLYIGLGSLGPTYVGFVAGRASYGVAFGGLATCLAVSSFVLLWLQRFADQGNPQL